MHLKDDLELATGNFIYDPVIGCENRLGSFYKNNHYLEDDLLDRHENNFTLDDIEDFNAGFTRLDSPSEYSDDSIYDLFNNQTSNLLFGNNTQGSLSDSFSFDDDQSLLSSTSTSSALNFNDDRDQFFDLDLFNEDSGSNEEVFPTVQFVKRCMPPMVIPASTVNFVKMTVVSPETSVQDVIKATVNHKTKQCFVVNGDNSKVFFLPALSNSSLTALNGGLHNDMPVLTPEQPFSRQQLIEYRCSYCQRLLSSKRTLTRHIRLHGPPKYKCGCCDRYFHDRSKLRRHYQSVHSQKKV